MLGITKKEKFSTLNTQPSYVLAGVFATLTLSTLLLSVSAQADIPGWPRSYHRFAFINVPSNVVKVTVQVTPNRILPFDVKPGQTTRAAESFFPNGERMRLKCYGRSGEQIGRRAGGGEVTPRSDNLEYFYFNVRNLCDNGGQ